MRWTGILSFLNKDTPPATEQRGLSLSDPELVRYFGIPSANPNIRVTDESVFALPPAWAAISYIADGIASLGRGVFQRDSDGDVFPDYTSPVAQLFNGRPHPHYNTHVFIQTITRNACLGNGFARIYRDDNARPLMLEIIPPEIVQMVFSNTGELFYWVSGVMYDMSVNYYLPATDMIHIKGVTVTGEMGRKVSLVHRDSISVAIGAQQYSNSYMAKGASVGGIYSFPNVLSEKQYNMLRAQIRDNYSGSGNAGESLILDGGADFKPVQNNPQQAAVLDFRNLTTVDISQIFKVPLHLLSQLDKSTFSNMEQQNQDFVIHCLQPWSLQIQEEFTTKLFTTSEVKNRRRFFAFDLSTMQMGDMQAQATFYASAIQNGWMTPNEVRGQKNLNKIEGGDKLFIQQNMAPMDTLEDILKGKYAATDAPDNGDPDSDTADEPQTETP